MKKLARITLLIGLLPLASCSYFNSDTHTHVQDKNFMEARSIPPTKIPPGISSSSFHNEYPVSNRHYPTSALKVSTKPPGL